MTTKQVTAIATLAGVEAAADRRYVVLTNGDRQTIVDTKYDNEAAVKQKLARVTE